MSPEIGLRPKRKVQRLQQIRFCYFPVYQNIIDGRPTKLMRAAGISTEGERPKIVDSYEKPGVRPKTPEPK